MREGEDTQTHTHTHTLLSCVGHILISIIHQSIIIMLLLLLLLFGSKPISMSKQQAKRGKISETGEAIPTKIDVHACYISPYLHEFFQPFLFN